MKEFPLKQCIHQFTVFEIFRHLKPDPYHKKYKTSVKWKNLNPEFHEEFAFETRPTELCTQSLYIVVYDKDYGKSNDYLGGLIVGGSGSKGKQEFRITVKKSFGFRYNSL